MPKPDERRYESAYDPEANLRVVRFVGRFEIDWLRGNRFWSALRPIHGPLPR